jgi:hypothetical protein
MGQILLVDAEGAVKVYLNTYPGLTGSGNPLANGIHLGKARSPSKGAIGELQAGPRTPNDISDDVRIQFRVKAVGSEGGARALAERACRKLAEAILALTGTGVTVTTSQGDLVRLLVAGDPQGPTFTGDVGGEATYTFDALIRCQPG